jgi:hypothetical protein
MLRNKILFYELKGLILRQLPPPRSLHRPTCQQHHHLPDHEPRRRATDGQLLTLIAFTKPSLYLQLELGILRLRPACHI